MNDVDLIDQYLHAVDHKTERNLEKEVLARILSLLSGLLSPEPEAEEPAELEVMFDVLYECLTPEGTEQRSQGVIAKDREAALELFRRLNPNTMGEKYRVISIDPST